MCYHYSIATTAEEIAGMYKIKLKLPQINPEPPYYHVNGFNFNHLPAVYKDNKQGELKLEFMQWGLVPGWVKGKEKALKIRSATLNARSETADNKPSFRSAFRYRPCLVPATGYFEWMHRDRKKYPFFIYLPGKPCFSFAGIWEEWINEQTGEILKSFSILTCEANFLTGKIHNSKKRMPVIVGNENESEDKWLNIQSDKSERKKILKPYATEKMDAYSISRLITSREKDTNIPEVLKSFKYPELSSIKPGL